MYLESLQGNYRSYEKRLAEFERERQRLRIWANSQQASPLEGRLLTHLGQWLVTWGVALQARYQAQARFAAPSTPVATFISK